MRETTPYLRVSCPLLVAVFLSAQYGCASTEPSSPAADANGLVYDATALVGTVKRVELTPPPPNADDLICRKEVPVGTHRAKTRCYTRAQAESIRKEAQVWLRTGGTQGGGTVVR
jgi:hypothetical protein